MEKHTHGFTLIELVLVIALVGIIVSFGATMSLSSLSQSNVTQERDLFVTLLLRGARAASLANVNEVSHGVQIDNTNHRYILFEGITYNASASSNRTVPYTNNVLNISNSGGDTIVFEQLSGNVITGTGTISISNGNANQNIIIRDVGQIDW